MYFKRVLIIGCCVFCIFLCCVSVAHIFSGRLHGDPNNSEDHSSDKYVGFQAPREDVLLSFPRGSTGDEMIVQVSVPGFDLIRLDVKGQSFQKISITGCGHTSETGKPMLPVKGFLLAVPEGSLLEVSVLDSETVTESCVKIYPVPKPEVREKGGMRYIAQEFVLDGASYSSNRYYPDKQVEVGFYGYLRDIRVAQLRVFPIQYNPAKAEIVFHRKIRLKVKLRGGVFSRRNTAGDISTGRDMPFDAVYRNSILNYDPDLKGTRATGAVQMIPEDDLEYLNGDPYKISVREDGIHEITYQDLVDAGADLRGVDPSTIKLYNLGREIPIFVFGEGDGAFDSSDYIVFFGLGNKGEYSYSNCYWLSWGGGSGLRMENLDCRPGDSLAVHSSFIHKVHFEEDNEYYPSVHEGEGKDHWYWQELLAPFTGEYPVTLPDVASSPYDVKMKISLLGKSGLSHHTQIYVNRYLAADLNWQGMIVFESNFTCEPRLLSRADNLLKIVCPSSELDQIFFNWIEFEYRRDYFAWEGVLRFKDTGLEPNQFEIAGFPDSLIELYRITDPHQVVRMIDYSIVPENSSYKLVFQDSLSEEEYLALVSGMRKKPVSIVRDEPSHLRSSMNSSDYIIITHEDFHENVQPLKYLRQAEGLAVKVVKVDDIYDEFGYGNFTPQAIKDFLSYAFYNWRSPSPSYVFLVGDASCDYKGDLPNGNVNFVPTHLFVSQTDYLETSSDDWFVCIVGDDMLPDMLIGRFTAQTEADIDAYVDKVISHETSNPPGDWRERVLLIADDPDDAGDFEAICDRLADEYIVPAGLDTVKIYLNRCYPNCRQAIINAINQGVVICDYVGHGSMDRWTRERVFVSSDVASLNNVDKYPLVLTYTCLNGYFHHESDDYSLAEEFVRAPAKGAIACLSHSGLSYAFYSQIMGEYHHGALLNDGNFIVGSAVCQAKIDFLAWWANSWDQAFMLTLFGDPALEMGFPGRPDILPGYVTFHPLYPGTGQPDTLKAVVFNAGRSDAVDVPVRFTRGHPDDGGSAVIADVTLPFLPAGGHGSATALWDSVPEAGKYGIFVHVDPQNQIIESCEWNNLLCDTMWVGHTGDVHDTIPPTVELFVNDKKVGVDFDNLDFVSPDPEIRAVLEDCESGINIGGISVTLNGEPVENLLLEHEGIGSRSVTLNYEPGILRDGKYTLRVEAADCGGGPNFCRASVEFVIESRLRIRNVRNYPNPWRDRTSFTFYLSQTADDVTFKVYSVNGGLIKTIRHPSGYPNFNSVDWDGRNENGNMVASGVYFYTVSVRGRRGKDEGKGKFVILR